MLGLYLRNLPQYNKVAGHGHSGGFPVDIQLPGIIDLRTYVQLEPVLRICPLWSDMHSGGTLRMEAGSRDQGQDSGRHEQTLEKVILYSIVFSRFGCILKDCSRTSF